jgi:hypothetical protein
MKKRDGDPMLMTPPKDPAPGEARMEQVDVER